MTDQSPILDEALFTYAIENMPGGIMVIESDLTIRLFNRRYIELYELPADLLKIGGSLVDMIEFRAQRGDYGPGDPNELVQARVGGYEGTGVQVMENRLPSGRILELTRNPLPDGGLVAICIDITERRKAEDGLAAQTAVLETVLENMDQGVVMYDSDLTITAVNQQARQNMKLSEDIMFVGAKFADIDANVKSRGDPGTGDTPAQTSQRWTRIRSGDSHNVEYVHADGTTIEIRRRAAPRGGFVVTQTDITSRKNTEIELKQQSETIRFLHRASFEASKAENTENALHAAMRTIGDYTNWPLGHVYLRSDDHGERLKSSAIWVSTLGRDYQNFRELSEKTIFESGIGLPGRVLLEGKANWISDIAADRNFPRARAALDLGLRAGFAMPVRVGEEVVAVLEFFATECFEPDERLLTALNSLGEQLGRVIERNRVNEALRDSEGRLLDILDQSPYGVSIVSRSEMKRLYVNRRFTELFGISASNTQSQRIEASYADPKTFQKNWDYFEKFGHIAFKEDLRKRRDGTLWWSLSDWRAIRFGTEDAVMVWHQDITEQKNDAENLQKALRQAEQFNRLTVNRELRMIEMKEEVDAMLIERGETPRYANE